MRIENQLNRPCKARCGSRCNGGEETTSARSQSMPRSSPRSRSPGRRAHRSRPATSTAHSRSPPRLRRRARRARLPPSSFRGADRFRGLLRASARSRSTASWTTGRASPRRARQPVAEARWTCRNTCSIRIWRSRPTTPATADRRPGLHGLRRRQRLPGGRGAGRQLPLQRGPTGGRRGREAPKVTLPYKNGMPGGLNHVVNTGDVLPILLRLPRPRPGSGADGRSLRLEGLHLRHRRQLCGPRLDRRATN